MLQPHLDIDLESHENAWISFVQCRYLNIDFLTMQVDTILNSIEIALIRYKDV